MASIPPDQRRPITPSLAVSKRGWQWVLPTWIGGAGAGLAVMAATILGAWWYASRIEPYWIQWRRITLPIRGLDPAFDGYQIVQLADLHLAKGYRFTPANLAAVIRRVNSIRPDLVVITGDFVSRYDRVSQQGMALLKNLHAPDGVLCVPGNHDYENHMPQVERDVERAGGEWLINCAKRISRGRAEFYVAGLDDAWYGSPELDQSLRGIPNEAPVILLVHEPNYADIAQQDRRVALQLSGHSHGGQVRIPGIGPIALPDQSWRYPMGLYRVARAADQPPLWVYTNRGLGLAEIPYRLFCRPEVTIFTLRAATGST